MREFKREPQHWKATRESMIAPSLAETGDVRLQWSIIVSLFEVYLFGSKWPSAKILNINELVLFRL